MGEDALVSKNIRRINRLSSDSRRELILVGFPAKFVLRIAILAFTGFGSGGTLFLSLLLRTYRVGLVQFIRLRGFIDLRECGGEFRA